MAMGLLMLPNRYSCNEIVCLFWLRIRVLYYNRFPRRRISDWLAI